MLLDACQSVGQLPIDVTDLGVDLLSATDRKWLRGPRGTGVLVVRSDIADRLRPRLVDLHGGTWTTPTGYQLRSDARVYELWEHGVAERLGLLAAVRYALDLGIGDIAAAVGQRAEAIREGLSAVPGVRVHDLGTTRCGLVSFTVDGMDSERVRDVLAARDIILTRSAATSTLLDMSRRGLDVLVRASPHYFVTPEQIDTFVRAVAKLRTRR